MPVSHAPTGNPSPLPSTSSALELLQDFVQRRQKAAPVTDFEAFEVELHEMMRSAECEVLACELAKLDVNVPLVEIDGCPAPQVGRYEKDYFTAAGKVRVMRSLYRPKGSDRSERPLDLGAGIVAGSWTPLAARQASWVTAKLTPAEGAKLFALMGGMSPSSSSLDRLPKKIGERWEADRKNFERLVREEEYVPHEAVTIAVSLDGVMVPMKGEETAGGDRGTGRGCRGQRPGTHREASRAAISFYDSDGERLHTLRYARMPESKKITLKDWIKEEAGGALAERPDLQLVKVADGALDNWTFLNEELPGGVEVIDFYHAAEHLSAALQSAHGEGSRMASQQYEKLRLKLRDEPDGAEKVIRSLRHLCRQHPRKVKLAAELAYFRKNRHRMRHAALLEANLPIGSGVTEATCKTLVTERLKRSGMSWGMEGGQAILFLRSLIQSERFDRAWNLLISSYKRDVRVPEGILEFPAKRAKGHVSA